MMSQEGRRKRGGKLNTASLSSETIPLQYNESEGGGGEGGKREFNTTSLFSGPIPLKYEKSAAVSI